jgi:membrane fusion protein, copper/silver efflux system
VQLKVAKDPPCQGRYFRTNCIVARADKSRRHATAFSTVGAVGCLAMSEHPNPAPHDAEAIGRGGALPEGDEAPPSGVRLMSTVRWALVAVVAVAAAATWIHWASELSSAHEAHEVHYRCPMHPTVVQDRPGECPICGMDLVRATGAHAAATAPAATAGATASAAQGRFWCPMHPDVASDDPAARCPKCGGMKLVPRPASAGGAAGAVPGLAPVELAPERTQLMGLRTARVARERIAPELRTVGFVTAKESSVVVVSPRFSGWVEEVAFAESGQRVEKGQVLATVYSQELLTAQQVYLNAVRWSETPQAGAPPPPKDSSAQRIDNDARRRLQLLGVAPEDIGEITKKGQPQTTMPVRAPAAGWIARRAAVPGLFVQPGTELFQIADLRSVWVVADVPERDAARIRVGERARLVLASRPGEAFSGRVQFVYPALNSETRTLQARMEFKNPGLALKPGMYGDVLVETAAEEGLTVPSDAVVDTGELRYVFLARGGGRFEPRAVRTGAAADGRVRVLDGLAEGDVVVTAASFLLDSESRLRAAVDAFAAPRDAAAPADGARAPVRVASP